MRDYLLYIALLLSLLILSCLEPVSSQWLMYDRELITSGQIWRLFSAHFVHLSLPHMAGNAMGLVLLGYIAGKFLNNMLGIILLLWCISVVGTGLYFYADYLQRYVGLSGVLHGLLMVAPFVSGYYSRKVAFSFLIIIVVKVVWEQSPWYDDMALLGTIGGRVEANAHLLGVVAGAIFLLVYCAVRYGRFGWALKKVKDDD